MHVFVLSPRMGVPAQTKLLDAEDISLRKVTLLLHVLERGEDTICR